MEPTKTLLDTLNFALGLALGYVVEKMHEAFGSVGALLAALLGLAMFFGFTSYRNRIPEADLQTCKASETSRQFGDASTCYRNLRNYYSKNSANHLNATFELINSQVLNAAFTDAYDVIQQPETRAHIDHQPSTPEKARLLAVIAFFYCIDKREVNGTTTMNRYHSFRACDSSMRAVRTVLPDLPADSAAAIKRKLDRISELASR